ncbi:hypothetical protein ACIRP7_23545 [Streptomyces sp. NPDC102270]|uniref:hypothetical protein n=1 Tax=Streptomyces sp. NPDC102270 TaxID=3366150 RepID=UPI003800D94A
MTGDLRYGQATRPARDLPPTHLTGSQPCATAHAAGELCFVRAELITSHGSGGRGTPRPGIVLAPKAARKPRAPRRTPLSNSGWPNCGRPPIAVGLHDQDVADEGRHLVLRDRLDLDIPQSTPQPIGKRPTRST